MNKLLVLNSFSILLFLVISFLLHRDHNLGFESFRNLGRDSTFQTYTLSSLIKNNLVKPGWGDKTFFNEFRPFFLKSKLISENPLTINCSKNGEILLRSFQYNLESLSKIKIKYNISGLKNSGIMLKLHTYQFENGLLTFSEIQSDLILEESSASEVEIVLGKERWIGFIDVVYINTDNSMNDVVVSELSVTPEQ